MRFIAILLLATPAIAAAQGVGPFGNTPPVDLAEPAYGNAPGETSATNSAPAAAVSVAPITLSPPAPAQSATAPDQRARRASASRRPAAGLPRRAAAPLPPAAAPSRRAAAPLRPAAVAKAAPAAAMWQGKPMSAWRRAFIAKYGHQPPEPVAASGAQRMSAWRRDYIAKHGHPPPEPRR